LAYLPFDFLEGLSSSSSLELEAFDKQSTLVVMGKSETSAALGILQGNSFNNRVYLEF